MAGLFPGGLALKKKVSACNAGATGNTGSSTGSRRSLEKGMATHSVFLPGASHGQRSLAG